jgi:hypothetical protein
MTSKKSNMQLLATVATAMLLQQEEGRRSTGRGRLPSILPNTTNYPPSEWKHDDDKENDHPTKRKYDFCTEEAKRPFVPAASYLQTDTPSSHGHISSSESSDIEFSDSDTDVSFKDEKPRADRGKAVHLDPKTSFDRQRPYWMQKEWIPTIQIRNSKGMLITEQKPPEVIRRELLEYLQVQKKSKTALLLDLGVNSNSFRKFMDRSNYKDPWRAGTSKPMKHAFHLFLVDSSISFLVFGSVENGTYWAAARYLEAERVDPNRANTSVVTDFIPVQHIPPRRTQSRSNQRSVVASAPIAHEQCKKRQKKSYREDAIELMERVINTPCDETEDRIYETHQYIIEQVDSIRSENLFFEPRYISLTSIVSAQSSISIPTDSKISGSARCFQGQILRHCLARCQSQVVR